MSTKSKRIHLFVVVLATLLLTLSCPELVDGLAKKAKCSEERARQMDECATKLGFFGDRSFRVPKNDSDTEKFCQTVKESINCIQAYSRDCLQGFTRQLMTSLLKRGKQQHNLICQDAGSRNDFRRRIGCMTDDKINQVHDSMDASIGRFEFIGSDKVANENRLPLVCCSYQIFQIDMDATVDRICGKPAKRQGSTNEYVFRIVGGTAGEFFGLICDGHRSLAECKSSSKTSSTFPLLEETTVKVKEGKMRPQHKSIVPPLLSILDSSS